MATWPAYAGLRAPICVVCCTPAAKCTCELIIPEFYPTSPAYSDLAAAIAQLTDYVANCLAHESNGTTGAPLVFTADNSTPDEIDIVLEVPGSSDTPIVGLDVSVAEATQLTFNFAQSPSGGFIFFQYSIYACATGELVDSGDDTGTNPKTFTSIPLTAGTYIVLLLVQGPATGTNHYTCNIVASDVMVVNPVVAAYDDSGTVRFLEACPKLLLPFGTEATGEIYANQVDAQAALDSDQVSNCVGYCRNAPPELVSFSASDLGSSLQLAGSISGTTVIGVGGSINAEKGKTISVAYNVAIVGGSGFTYVTFTLFFQDGIQIDQPIAFISPTDSGSLVSISLPYTGKYFLDIGSGREINSGTPTNDSAFTITSSGVLTVNPAQALYDRGVDCPARLDCA